MTHHTLRRLFFGATLGSVLCGHIAMYAHIVADDAFWTTVFTVDAILLGAVAMVAAMAWSES